ncbi:MAG: DUF1957 domain-containing protein [Deltaproteobacteria bacterium]|nr:DUF1957 domain-containing protein [Deltaproteobacteria bacterium]
MSRSVVVYLHSHLPWVLGHGRWPHGSDWLCEAVAETYLPLTAVFRSLLRDGIHARCVLGVTPVLAEQLAHPEFAKEFEHYLAHKIDSAERDARNFASTSPELEALARRWIDFYRSTERLFFTDLGCDLVGAWRSLAAQGAIELATSAATHGYLPLLARDDSIRRQLAVGVATHTRHFGRRPHGVWLPECAYRPAGWWESPFPDFQLSAERPGVETFLDEAGLGYFVVDSHLFRGGRPATFYLERFQNPAVAPARTATIGDSDAGGGGDARGRFPIDRAYTVGDARVAVFARDPAAARQVWSRAEGYPGDGAYLEFHKKHYPGGMRYWSVTESGGDLGAKQVYDPALAEVRVRSHAEHFVGVLGRSLAGAARGVACVAFDTELFGHWWFEGPAWLEAVLRAVARKQADFSIETPGHTLEAVPPSRSISLPEGSWGDGGGHGVWLNDNTRWTWRLVYDAELRMAEAARRASELPAARRVGAGRILREMGRELLLLESSDWQFLITTAGAPDYAERRLREHHDTFRRIAAVWERFIERGALSDEDGAILDAIEKLPRPFAAVDERVWWGEGKAGN